MELYFGVYCGRLEKVQPVMTWRVASENPKPQKTNSVKMLGATFETPNEDPIVMNQGEVPRPRSHDQQVRMIPTLWAGYQEARTSLSPVRKVDIRGVGLYDFPAVDYTAKVPLDPLEDFR